MVKHHWDKFKILSQFLIGIAVVLFSVVFGVLEHQNAKAKLELAHSNYKIAKAQVQVALLPPLFSKDPKKRAMVYPLAKILDEDFASMVSKTAIVRDSNETVQRSARETLESLLRSPKVEVKESVNKSLNQYNLIREVKALGFQKELDSARSYIEGGSPNGKEKAVNIYRRILVKLPYGTLRKLDQGLLRSAQEDEQRGYWDSAARKYMALFPEPIY